MLALLAICPDDEESCKAWTILASLSLLMFAYLIANVFHAFHWNWVPESCIFLSCGMIFSGFFLIRYSSDELYHFMTLNDSSFILILLPPIIFEGGYSLKKIYFVRNIGVILMLALVGTAVSAFIIGGMLWIFSNYASMPPENIGWSEAMSVGSLLSATDPVAALAVYSSLGIDRTLYTLVYGESNLNDAIGIVLFRTFREIYDPAAGHQTDLAVGWEAFFQFIEVTIVAPLLGIITGLVAALIFKFAKFRDIPIIETIVFWAFSYISYLVGEAPGFSGIISTLFCGFFMRHYAYHNLSEKGQFLSIDVIKFLATTADTVIFLNLGIAAFAYVNTTWNAYTISITLILCLVSRALVVFPILWLSNRMRNVRKSVSPVSFKHQLVVYHAGLRGAVAFVLALELTQGKSNDYWLATTIAIILFTNYFLGGTTAELLKILGIGEDGKRSKHITEVSSEFTEVFYPWDKKYFAKIFVAKDRMDLLVGDDGSENQEDINRAKILAKLHASRGTDVYNRDGYHSDITNQLDFTDDEHGSLNGRQFLGYETT